MPDSRFLEQTEQIRPGDHLVALYEREDEIVEYITSYVHTSLLRNERCVYITGDADTPRVLGQIRKMAEGIDMAGNLVVFDKDEVYSKNGKFDPDRMIEMIIAMVGSALADGYSGLAVTGEISWVLDYENGCDLIIEYEWKLNERIFEIYSVSALCRYSLLKFSNEMIINIIQLHPYILWHGKIHSNPFYIPAEGFKNNEISKYQVQSWLNNIDRFTDAKSHFREAIVKKEQEMQQLHITMTDSIIMAMVELLSIHDAYTNNHSENVAFLASNFANYLGLPDSTVEITRYAGLIHDIGKTLVSKEILNKPGQLTREEYLEIQKHPTYGASVLSHVEMLHEVSDAVRYHHERWDGQGYPAGLQGEQIPFLARILQLADSFDAMTNDRPYRHAMSRDVALDQIMKCSGSQFDAGLAERFVSMIQEDYHLDQHLSHSVVTVT